MAKRSACPFRGFIRLGLLLLFVAGGHVAKAEPLQVGAEDDWYPYTAWRDGRIQGMSADIVRAAFAAVGEDVELVPYPYARCMQLAQSGRLAACFNTAPNAEIERDYLLPRHPLFRDDILLWAPSYRATPVTNLGQLAGRRVAVTVGYEYGETFDRLADVVRVTVRKDISGFLMLQHDRVDYVAAYRGTTEALVRDNPELRGLFTAVATLHQPELYLSFSRQHPGAPALLQRFDEGMAIIQGNGRYRAILSQWGVGG